ncbi:MAG: M28 family peptidase [Cyclobacteriaceae bacterium]|nr:M28 family peptidase [Cyclobacteriaceae bacterium]
MPKFFADSSYYFVEKQVSFGPRVPNTTAHVQTGNYLIDKLKAYGASVTEQHFTAFTYDAQKLTLRNIIATFYPEKQKRILLAAHWDSRPFADKDTDRQDQPIDGANDGASGVAVLLEIARVLSLSNPPEVGVDIILFDGEDWGEKYNEGYVQTPDTLATWYCLGSQHWARNKHEKNYSAYYGILLDMVGAQGSQFRKEGLSVRVAPKVVEKIWKRAEKLGYSNYFVNARSSEITDDHQFVNDPGKIPMVNIVHYDPVYGYFGNYHHTHLDNISIIDKETLRVVGETLLNVIYYEE